MIADTLLPSLSDWRPTGPGPHSFAAPLENSWEVAITAEHAESLGCKATEITVRRPAGVQPTAADLTQWAVRTAKRVTGLLEPLKLLEVDAGRSEAILRSDEPAVRGNQVDYYELRLRGTHEGTLHRYHADRTGGKREAVPFALTHEAIAKIADDLTAE